jgi:predicted DNA-binding antitoxin AbrB/MazE fold protein
MTDKRKSVVTTTTDKAAVTLVGTVDKIIPPIVPREPEKVQISVETAEALYRELRIDNKLRDPDGKPVSLEEGAKVEVTIEADPKAISKKD